MKAKNKVILGSALAIAMSASMIAGTTFALFTSESSVNIAVTSAKVGITAKIEEGESKSTLGGEALGKFSTANGIALENIAPGDVYSFTVKAENSSSIAINYRTTIEFTNPVLASALDVTIGDVTYSGLMKYATAWTKIEEPKGAIEDLEVEIAFPALEESQNQFQNLSTDIKVMVEGVQGNTVVSNADSELVLSVNNGAQLEKAVKTAKDAGQNATINLVSDVALTQELYIDQFAYDLTINGNGYKITADAENFQKHLQGQFNLVKINDAVALYDEQNNFTGYDLKIHDNTITLQNVVLEHNLVNDVTGSCHTLDVYGAKNVVLDNVTLIREFTIKKGGAALTINASSVTATDLCVVTGGCAWGGINVDGVNGEAILTLKSGFNAKAANTVAVWCEHGGVVVDEENVLMPLSATAYTMSAAKIGDTKYTSLEAAIAALQEGDTLNIMAAGQYKALTIDKKNVTVNGLLGADKASSAVFAGLVAKAENVTFNDMYVEYGEGYDSGYYTKTGVTYNNCTFVGNGTKTALYVHVPEITITNCTFENWGSALYTCGDNHAAVKILIDGNTFINVNSPFDGYWGKAADTSVQYNIIFTNNTISNDNGIASVQLWDYTQWLNSAVEDRIGSAVRALVSGNTGAFDLYLTHFDTLWETTANCTIELGEGQNTIYRSFVAFEGVDDYANYEIRNADGSALTTYNAMTAINRAWGAAKGCYACCTGNYILVNKTTGETVAQFSVTNPVLDETQVVTIG